MSQQFNGMGSSIELLTKANSDISPCVALWVGTAGTANITDIDGEARTDVPLKEGLFPVGIKRLSTGGTADDIWAIR